MNTTTIIKEEYTVFIKLKDSGKYIRTAHPRTADTLEKCKSRYEEYRKEWEHCSKGLDLSDYEIRHRTVITSTTEWEVVK